MKKLIFVLLIFPTLFAYSQNEEQIANLIVKEFSEDISLYIMSEIPDDAGFALFAKVLGGVELKDVVLSARRIVQEYSEISVSENWTMDKSNNSTVYYSAWLVKVNKTDDRFTVYIIFSKENQTLFVNCKQL
jgi:hypothetical protein